MEFMNTENSETSTDSITLSTSAKFIINRAGRLRSGWRFLIFQVLFVIFGAAFGETISFLLAQMSVVYERGSVLSFVVQNSVLLVRALVLGWLCGRFLEGLPFRALGAWFTKNWFKDFAFGLIVGAASISFAVLIAAIFGGMRLEANNAAGATAIGLTLGVSLFVFTVGAAAEEAYFRGYILQTFARAHLVWIAIGFTALYFAAAHLRNPNVSNLAIFNTILAGVWFVIAYLKTRNLWFPFGIHLAWNWFQGAIFGVPVSGISSLTTAPVFVEANKGIDLWTGGDYGVEGGIACTIAIIVSGVLIYFAAIFKPSEEMLRLTSEENSGIKQRTEARA